MHVITTEYYVFTGEYVTEWLVPNATKEEYHMYANVQMDVFGQATFGGPIGLSRMLMTTRICSG
jgi:hypothetical protein